MSEGRTPGTLKRLRETMRLQQRDVARHIPRANADAKPIDDTLLSRLEREQIELGSEFVWTYLEALLAAHADRDALAHAAVEAVGR